MHGVAIMVSIMNTTGNKSILNRPLTAFYCSVRCPGNLIIKTYDLAQQWRVEEQPVIGGFHSPVEKEVLKILFRSLTPVCIVLARGLPKRFPPEYRRPLDEGRLLIVSPFESHVRRATAHTAIRRNEVVAQLAARIFVAYAAPGSKTESFCLKLVSEGKPCQTFDDPKTTNLTSAKYRPRFPVTGNGTFFAILSPFISTST